MSNRNHIALHKNLLNMSSMHNNELNILEEDVRKLLIKQCPNWADLALQPILSSGTDNTLFRLGNNYVVRLPRIEWSPGDVTHKVNKEYHWLPQLAPFIQVPISEPVFIGKPTDFYPWPWTITRWNEGYNPAFEKDNEYAQLAVDLATFLNQLHAITLKDGPPSRRGVSLKKFDAETTNAIKKLTGEIDTTTMLSVWHNLSNTPLWNKAPVWLHGDLLPGNILIQNNRLNAVIDFADIGMGDPACDLIIAWSLLNPSSRELFKSHLDHIDQATWERGKGWALSIALIILPYYKHSNPALVAIAERMLEQILKE
jgi:aminoglycoside phosphotransferase (APT) family kinase protein